MSKSPTWRKTPFAKPFYHSRAWQDVRSFVLDRAHGLCERCLEKGVYKPADVVHHKVPLSPENMNDPDIALNPERLIALCDDCHTEVHQELGIGAMNGPKPVKPRVGFDKFGNVVELREERLDIIENGDGERYGQRD